MDKIHKKGYLKFDLYSFESDAWNKLTYSGFKGFWLKSKEEKDNTIEDFTSRFGLVLKKGTEFVCFLDNGTECWYDNVNYGVEHMDAGWAANYLENIVEMGA